MNSHECIGAIVFAGKKLAQLKFLELANQPVVLGCDFMLGVGAHSGVCFFGG